ncbi:MAG: hypothetical protein ACLTWE_16420 [Dysgonomonas mossii]|uniref:hypothetical protein n=1 Tax=Dysgonomonas mossii TaxID=163665 RepID=UPI0039963EF3
MIIEIGKRFRHISLSYMTCVIMEGTSKGWKVKQTETFSNSRKKPKETIKFYYHIDFDAQKGLWKEMNESITTNN